MATQWATRESKRTSFKSNVEEIVTAWSSWRFSKFTQLVWPVPPSHEPSSILPLTPSDENGDNSVTKDPSQCSLHLSRSSFLDESGPLIPNPAPAVASDAQNPEALYTPISESQSDSLDVASAIQPPVSAPIQAASTSVDSQDREVGQVHTIVNPGLALSSVVSANAAASSQNDVSDPCLTRDVETTCQVTCDFESRASRSSTRTQTQPADSDLVILEYVSGMAEPICRDKFMLPHAEISSGLAEQWATIQTKLDTDLKLITAKLGLRFDQIITSAQFAVVGPKVDSQIHGIPTVVITCGSKKCEKLVKKALLKGQFQCLKDLRHPVLVRYKAPPALWYAAQSPPLSAVKQHFPLRQRALFIELLHPQHLACSRRLKFEDVTDGLQIAKISTIGGMINVDGEIYGLTSAHAIFASLGNECPADRDNSDLRDNSSDLSEDESAKGDASDEDINQEISNVSSGLPDSSAPGIDISEGHMVLWSTLEWDGACNFAGWGGTFGSPQSACFEMRSQNSSSDWAIFRISDPSMKNEPNMYSRYDGVRKRYERTVISRTIMSNHQLTPGPVWIVTDNNAPASSGTLTQTATSLYFNGASLHVRQIMTKHRLGPGASGSWVARGPSLCGYIVAGDNHANLALMVTIEDCFVDLKSVLGAQSVLVHDGLISSPKHNLHVGSNSSDDPPDPRKSGQPFARSTVPSHWSQNASPSSRSKDFGNFRPDADTTALAMEPQAAQASSATTTVLPSRYGRRNSEDDEFELEHLGPISKLSPFGPRRTGYQLLHGDRGDKAGEENVGIDLSTLAGMGYQLNEVPKNPNVVTFDGPNDPYNPQNWTSRKRWAVVYVMSAFVFVSSLASSMVAPCLNPISAEFHMDPTSVETQIVFSVFVLAFAIGPMVFGPLSELYGRVVVLLATNAIFLGFNLACGFATNKAELIAFRFLAGLGGSAPLAIGGAILGDLFKPKERGKAMGVYAMGPLLGPTIGPIVGGLVAQYTNWRWLFWATSMADAVILIVGLFYLRESYAPLLLYRKCKLMRKRTGNPNLRPAFPDIDQPAITKLRTMIVRSFSLLFSQPIVQVLGIYMAFAYGCLYLVLSTFPTLWESHYNESPGVGGLNYISIGLGFFIGAPLIGKTNDKVYNKLKAKDLRKQGKPELRMPLMIPLSFLVPIGFLLYGWAAEAHLPRIVPNIGAFIFGMGTIAAFQCVTTYLVDSYTRFAPLAIAAVTVLRSLAGFGFPLFAPIMYKTLGYGWGNSVLGFAAICIGLPAPVLLWLIGEKLRRKSKFAVGSKP